MRNLVAFVCAFLLATAASDVLAQSDGVTGSATVLTEISVTGNRGLSFGNIAVGSSQSVAHTSGSSAYFDVSGEASTAVSLAFTLPNESPGTTGYAYALQLDGSDGTADSHYLQLDFSATDANWDATTVDGNSDTENAFDPKTASTSATLNGSGTLEVFLGGTVTATASQTAGLYNGTITLTVEY